MLKLIDVFQLSKDIEEYFLSKIDKNEYEVDSVDCHADIQAILRSQPTAYDSDKVAEEVREVADRILNYCEEIDWHIPEEERTGYEMLPDIWKLSEIVEKGGVADET